MVLPMPGSTRISALVDAALHADTGARGFQDLVAALQAERDVVAARAEHVLSRIAPADFALASGIGIAVGARFRLGAIVPVPLGERAVELLVVVGAADQLHGERH